MSWTNDIRCLYCDGKLPLYRKITSGQFCSASHCKAYWQEQERLAVERLHQTHNSLHAHRPSAISGTKEDKPAPEFGGLVPFALRSSVYTPGGILGDPLAIEITSRIESPLWRFQNRAAQGLSMAILVPVDIPIGATCLGRLLSEPSPLECVGGLSGPARSALRIQRELMFAGPMALALAARILAAAPELSAVGEATPLGPNAQPLYPSYVAASAKNDELYQFRDDQVPHADKLLPLSRPAVREGAIRIAEDAGQTTPIFSNLLPQFPADRTGFGARVTPFALIQGGPMALALAGSVVPAAPELLATGEATPLGPNVEPLYPSYVAASPKNEELYQLRDDQVPRADKLLSLSRPAVRDGNIRIAEQAGQTMPIFASLPPQFPASSDRHGPAPITLAQAGLSRLFIDHIPLVQGAWIDNLRAVESGGAQAPPLMLATPSRRPRLRMAASSRCPVDTREGETAALAEVEPAGFSTASPRISLPLANAPCAQSPIPAPGVAGLLPLKLAAGIGRPGPKSIPAPRLSLPVPQRPSLDPIRPGSKLEPLEALPPEGMPAVPAEIVRRSYQWAYIAAIPLVLGLALYSWVPPAAGGIPRAFESAVNTQFANARRTVLERAAVALNEDFRAGLDEWTSRDGASTDWSFDSTGFVRPGPLGLYRPSLGLRDYQMQFLGLIDKKALSWVVRAADFRNYYVVKLVVLKAGPLPRLGVIRYAVVNGRADSRVETVAAIDARPDTLYRVRMDLRGDTFLLTVQGQIVDNWSEPRLKHGGVGLFSSTGEASRVRWVQVTHQYDVLGRLCAYLAPYDFQMTNGSWK